MSAENTPSPHPPEKASERASEEFEDGLPPQLIQAVQTILQTIPHGVTLILDIRAGVIVDPQGGQDLKDTVIITRPSNRLHYSANAK